MRHILFFLYFLLAIIILHDYVMAGSVRAYFSRTKNDSSVVLENDSVKITFADSGGKVIEWYVKSLKKDIALWDQNVSYAVIAQRFAVFGDSTSLWPEPWPTTIGSDRYQTQIFSLGDQKGHVKQSLTVAPPSVFAGLKVEKFYTLSNSSYELDVDYVISNTSNNIMSYQNNGKEYGINLTVETTMLCGVNYAISFESGDSVYSSPFVPVLPNPVFNLKVDWCAIEDKDGGYVMGTFFPADSTCGLWPGEERPGGRDYEIIFRSMIYHPGDVESYHLKICGGPGSIKSFKQGVLSNPTLVGPLSTGNLKGFVLNQNYPNPFNPSTIISYSLATNTTVTLKIYDVLGRELKTLVDEYQSVGNHSIILNATDLSSGIYFYQLQTGEKALTKKFMVIK
jgi:hypothetical protein